MSRRRTAANTGAAGANHRVAYFAGLPAPTGDGAVPRFTLYLWGLPAVGQGRPLNKDSGQDHQRSRNASERAFMIGLSR